MTGLPGLPPLLVRGERVGRYLVLPRGVRNLGRSGWREFALDLATEAGTRGSPPAVEGIYSRGGKDGVRPWMDVELRDGIVIGEEEGAASGVSLRRLGIDVDIVTRLGEAIPPGGHLMVAYEGEEAIHKETLECLARGAPPAATPIGRLLVLAGFTRVKDWYLAEGGMEGPRKLWGDKAPDAEWEGVFRRATGSELRAFLGGAGPPEPGSALEEARAAAQELAALLSDR